MKHQPHTDDTTFMQRNRDRTKQPVWTFIISTLMAGVTGTVIPMLEQWHSDNQTSAQIDQVTKTFEKDLDLERQDRKDADRALWESIGRLNGSSFPLQNASGKARNNDESKYFNPP